MLRLAVTLASVVSLACLGAEPVEAISFDKPIRVVDADARVRWASDGGTCLTPAGWGKVDAEYVRLQRAEQVHKTEPSPATWFFAGIGTGAAVVAVVASVLYAVTR